MKFTRVFALICFLSVACGGPPLDEGDCERSNGQGVDCSKCCRICDEGKACGDSCIASGNNCNQPAGCACDRR